MLSDSRNQVLLKILGVKFYCDELQICVFGGELMKISFVIPTFNFGQFLPATLDSIIDEGYQDTEIIIFDGGSTDSTVEIVDEYRNKYPSLIFMQATQRGNIDIDLNLGVNAATGDYIWTLSADDVLCPGWSKSVMSAVREQKPDIVLVPAIHCDIHMVPKRNYPILKNLKTGPIYFTIKSDDDLVDYINNVRTSEGLFSFCSACIVRRDRLIDMPQLEGANGTCWRYSVRLMDVLTQYPCNILVFDKAKVLKRGDNDSFSNAGVINRLAIATLKWDEATSHLNLRSSVLVPALKLAKGDIRPLTLLYFTQFIRNAHEQNLYNQCVRSRLSGTWLDAVGFSIILRNFPRFEWLKRGSIFAKSIIRILQNKIWQHKGLE
jgi:abequosyltransferase